MRGTGLKPVITWVADLAELAELTRLATGLESEYGRGKVAADDTYLEAYHREKFPVVIIKPSPDATYKNTVDMLDEMTINVVKRYAIVDVLDVEKELVARTQAAGGAGD